jgi:hypothetical protein
LVILLQEKGCWAHHSKNGIHHDSVHRLDGMNISSPGRGWATGFRSTDRTLAKPVLEMAVAVSTQIPS